MCNLSGDELLFMSHMQLLTSEAEDCSYALMASRTASDLSRRASVFPGSACSHNSNAGRQGSPSMLHPRASGVGSVCCLSLAAFGRLDCSWIADTGTLRVADESPVPRMLALVMHFLSS